MLEFIYYPVSFILWCWHWVFGKVFGDTSAIAWSLAIVFLVWTLRAIMFKPFVKQVRSMRQMQEFAPEIKKIQKKYANDRQRQAQEMQKLQREHGFSPLGGCLPMLLQIPVFIGLFHVLKSFAPPDKNENYFFDREGVASYAAADLFGARLSNFITQPTDQLTAFGADVSRVSVILVSIPLMVLASVLTHLTARHSVSRQNPEAATPQTAIMNKITLYLFPVGVLVFGAFFPIGLLIYWLANNTWTLMQQRIVYRRIDREEAAKKTAAKEKRDTLAPKPGQKPVKKRPPQAKPAGAGTDGEEPAADSPPESGDGATPAKKPAGRQAQGRQSPGKPQGRQAQPRQSQAKQPPGKQPPPGKKPPAKKPPAKKPTNASGTEVPGLISDQSRSKRSGRKDR